MKEANVQSGSTAVVGLLMGNKCYLSNAGDSRAVASKAGKAVRLTNDHKPDRLEEIDRITKLGGEITTIIAKDGKVISRVGGLLAVSRSFGDFDLAPYITAEPEVTEIDLGGDEYPFLILACDGVWDVLTDQEAVDVVAGFLEQHDVERAAARLRDVAYARGSQDNITLMVIKLLSHKEMEDEANGITEDSSSDSSSGPPEMVKSNTTPNMKRPPKKRGEDDGPQPATLPPRANSLHGITTTPQSPPNTNGKKKQHCTIL